MLVAATVPHNSRKCCKQGRDKEALYVQELLRGQEIRESTNTRSSPCESTNSQECSQLKQKRSTLITQFMQQLEIPLTETEQKVPDLNESIIALGYQITECKPTNSQKCSQLTQKRSELLTQQMQQLEGLDKLIRNNRKEDDVFFDPTI